MFEILKMKFDQDLCLNLFELWSAELNPQVRCAFGNVLFQKVTSFIHFCIFHPGNSSMNEKWLNNKIKDEPVIGSNTRGTISFATNGPDSRTSVVDEKKYNHKF